METDLCYPLYGAYAGERGFSAGTATLIAVYCLISIASLLFGRFSDEAGRRRVVLLGLLVIAAGSLLSP